MRHLMLFSGLVLALQAQDSSSRNQLLDDSNNNVSDPCDPYVQINSTLHEIHSSHDRIIRLHCKVTKDFQYIDILLKLKRSKSNTNINFSATDLRMINHTRWYDIEIKVLRDYLVRWVTNSWSVSISVEGEEPVIKTSGLYSWGFDEMKVSAAGRSLWKKSKPDKQCSEIPVGNGESTPPVDNGESTPSVDNGKSTTTVDNEKRNIIMWILIIIIVVIIVVVLTISMAVYKIRHPKDNSLPRVNLEMQEREFATDSNGTFPQAERPISSHDSENSLYGYVSNEISPPQAERPISSYDSENSLYGVI